MKKLFTYLFLPKVLLTIIVLETVALGALVVSMRTNSRSDTQVLAQSTDISFDEDIRACLRMPVSDRPMCAKLIGTKLTGTPLGISEKVDQCMKLRPLYVRYCMEALQNPSGQQ